MQLIHAIVALVAASQATAMASNANLMARSSIAETANIGKSDCLEKCASDNQGEDVKAKRGNDKNDDDDKERGDGDDKKNKKKKKKEKQVKCFDQCSPHPGQNLCHESAPCLYITGQSKYYCGCPTGLKPDDISPENAFRLPWSGQEGRVFVKPGVSCYNRCEDILTCAEVSIQPQCF